VRIPTRDNHKIPSDQFHWLSGTRNLHPAFAVGNDVKCSSVIGDTEAPWRAELRPKVNTAPKMN
jgi:hypothetical protein